MDRLLETKSRWKWLLRLAVVAFVVSHTSQNRTIDGIEILEEIKIVNMKLHDSRKEAPCEYPQIYPLCGDESRKARNKSKEINLHVNLSTNQLPKDLFTLAERRHGAIVIHVLVVIYVACALYVICSFYFIPALEITCYYFDIQEDVGGATLMTWGNSLPDLCATVVGVLVTDGDVGLATAVGASSFNILFVVGICGIISPESFVLTWWSLIRDIFWYILSLSVLVVILYDKKVLWQESLILMFLYLFYIFMLWQNKRIEMAVYAVVEDKETFVKRFGYTSYVQMKQINKSIKNETCDATDSAASFEKRPLDVEMEEIVDNTSLRDEDSIPSIFQCPEGSIINYIAYVIILPIKLVFFLTIPDLRYPQLQKFFPVTFTIGMLWISLFSYVIVWMITVIGQTLRIPDSVMGVNVVCVATSLPDIFCTVIVSRQGKTDMALSQALGGSTFNILLGLGFSWFLKAFVKTGQRFVGVSNNGLSFAACINIALGFLILFIFVKRKFCHDKRLGFLLVSLYVFYSIVMVIDEVFLINVK